MSAQQTVYDCVIVGAGVSGGLIAKQLALKGKKVLILEAGAEIPANIGGFMERFYLANAKIPEIPYTPPLFKDDQTTLFDPGTVNAGRPTVWTLGASNWQNPNQAYLIQQGPLAFASTYDRVGAGTTRHWLGTSLRFVPNDFKMKTVYGQEVDWPLEYGDLERWYGLAEHEIGVSANVADQAYLGITFPPNYNYPMMAIPMSLVDEAVEAGVSGLTVDDIALGVTSTPAGRNSQPYQSRRVCAGNTNCIPICPIQAKYDASVTINEALDTGNTTVLYRSVANNVTIDGNGNVTGIGYIQYANDFGQQTGTGTAVGKVYVLAAHAIETPKLMLMSTNGGRTPNGISNSSGQVGCNLMDHPLYLAWALAKDPIFPYRGPLSTSGIESLRDGAFRSKRAAYRIEIGNEGWNFPITDPYTTTLDFINGTSVSQLNPNNQALWGNDLIDAYNSHFIKQFRLAFLVEQTPDSSNRVTLSATAKDHLGLPRPQITYNFSQYTIDGLISAKKTADQIFARMGATQYTTPTSADQAPTAVTVTVDGKQEKITYYGSGHVVGTYRMGADKNSSVCDRNTKSWDHPNLYFAGSGVFPTVATANPTLTIAALALRTADAILTGALKG